MLPELYCVKSTTRETHDTFTLTFEGKSFSFLPGQFNMLYLFGIGECAISLSGNPEHTHQLVHTIRVVGHVTSGLLKLKEGDEIGIRGPFGSSWPLNKKGCDVLIVAGGVGLAPLRSALFDLIKNRAQYNTITLLYGARTPDDILYEKEMEEWEKNGIEVKVSVDVADLTWKGSVGVVTSLIESSIKSSHTLVFLCGPEIMLKFAIQALLRTQVKPQNIYLAMERNMQCAVGFCGHCQYGPYFICKDGPIFSFEQVKYWLNIKEL